MTRSRSAVHFQRLYQANPDPWRFRTSSYEHAKYHQTVAALGEREFEAGLEVGCSIGVLTRMLAPRCRRMLGVDIVEDPLQAARERCADLPQVRFERMQVPLTWPHGRFDLFVFSEVLYFMSPEDIDRCARHVLDTRLPNSMVLLVNWLGQTDDPSPAHVAPNRMIEAMNGVMSIVRQECHDHYRLDLLAAG
jgi:2-polyprenyl-3-methyl-5-hydroxy-6-metoxy-1,4-benzoquinol methylase